MRTDGSFRCQILLFCLHFVTAMTVPLHLRQYSVLDSADQDRRDLPRKDEKNVLL